jgi:hypothetical protein
MDGGVCICVCGCGTLAHRASMVEPNEHQYEVDIRTDRFPLVSSHTSHST